MDQILAIFYVLLGLAVIVSLFGIVNTLALSVLERTRELGMLRAIGMSRRQVRRMVRHESVVTALIGATLGIAVGLFLAALATTALSGEGLRFAVPIGSLVAFMRRGRRRRGARGDRAGPPCGAAGPVGGAAVRVVAQRGPVRAVAPAPVRDARRGEQGQEEARRRGSSRRGRPARGRCPASGMSISPEQHQQKAERAE